MGIFDGFRRKQRLTKEMQQAIEEVHKKDLNKLRQLMRELGDLDQHDSRSRRALVQRRIMEYLVDLSFPIPTDILTSLASLGDRTYSYSYDTANPVLAGRTFETNFDFDTLRRFAKVRLALSEPNCGLRFLGILLADSRYGFTLRMISRNEIQEVIENATRQNVTPDLCTAFEGLKRC